MRKLFWGVALIGLVGCAGLDRFGTKVDMTADRMVGGKKPEYEGKLVAIESFGSMTSLQFADDKVIEVEDAQPGLSPGDTVRIYKTSKGLAAHLWRARENDPSHLKIPPVPQQK